MKKVSLICVLAISFMLLSSCEKSPNGIKTQENNVATTEAEITTGNLTEEVTPATTEEITVSPLKLDIEDYPRVDGSTATIPLSLSTFMTLTGASQEEAESTIIHTKTANAYARLISLEVDLLIVYAAPDTINEQLKNSEVKLIMEPVGKDALVFMTNEDNPVASISQEEIVDVYSGKIDNWRALGGSDIPIVAYQRPDDSGSQTLMKSLVMKEVPFMDAPSFLKPEMMGELIDRLLDYDNTANSLGYSVYYYAKNMYEKPGLKFLQIDEIEPNNQTIQEGSYPYVKDFYVVIRESQPKDSPAYQVFEWLLSDAGQQLVTENGYVSIR